MLCVAEEGVPALGGRLFYGMSNSSKSCNFPAGPGPTLVVAFSGGNPRYTAATFTFRFVGLQPF